MKRWISFILIVSILPILPVRADPIKWVDFRVPYESLEYAMNRDIDTYEKEKHISWIDILRWRLAAQVDGVAWHL